MGELGFIVILAVFVLVVILLPFSAVLSEIIEFAILGLSAVATAILIVWLSVIVESFFWPMVVYGIISLVIWVILYWEGDIVFFSESLGMASAWLTILIAGVLFFIFNILKDTARRFTKTVLRKIRRR